MNKYLLLLFLVVLAFPSMAQTTRVYCLDNVTLQQNITIVTTVDSEIVNTSISEQIRCIFGCDNATGGLNDCNPDRTQPTLFVLVPPIALFGAAFLLLYLGTQSKGRAEWQFFFIIMSLFVMIANVWYAQRQDVFTFFRSTGDVLTSVYYALIIVVVVVIFYFIINIIREALVNARLKKTGLGA